jgi:hypothetical protein
MSEEVDIMIIKRPNLKQCIMLMADYASTGLWDHGGKSIGSSKLPISNELISDISAWVSDYEDDYFDNNDYTLSNWNSTTVQKDYELFSQEGMILANRLQIELPDWSIAFFDEHLGEHLYINDPIEVTSAWIHHLDVDNYKADNIEDVFDWLEENEVEYSYRWWGGDFWLKNTEDATMFTLRWA